MNRSLLTYILVIPLIACTSENADTGPEEAIDKSDTTYVAVDTVINRIDDPNDLAPVFANADYVVAYNYNHLNGNAAAVECTSLYVAGSLCKSATNKKVLSPEAIAKLVSITTDSSTYSQVSEELSDICFIPHIGFGFYVGDSVIAQINICFLCDGIRMEPGYAIEALSPAGEKRLEDLARELELKIVDADTDLSY